MKLFQMDYQGIITELEGEVIDHETVRVLKGTKRVTMRTETVWYKISIDKSIACAWYLNEKRELLAKAQQEVQRKEQELGLAIERVHTILGLQQELVSVSLPSA